MSILSVVNVPESGLFLRNALYLAGKDFEKSASNRVRLSGLLQLLSTGQLVLSVPSALVKGLFDAMHEPGIMLPPAVGGVTARTCIVVMTAEEVTAVGGGDKITERGQQFTYNLLGLTEQPARNWPGIGTCWHMRVMSPGLTKLRASYGLPKTISGSGGFSILIACRKVGVLASNDVSKATTTEMTNILPDWES